MIDMVFLLLVFFMTAATLSKVDFTPEIELPVAPKAQVPDDLRARGTINILPEAFVLSDGRAVTKDAPFMISGEFVDAAGLTEQIASLSETEPDLRVYMRVDKNTEFRKVREAIAACAQAGIFNIVFASYQSGGGG